MTMRKWVTVGMTVVALGAGFAVAKQEHPAESNAAKEIEELSPNSNNAEKEKCAAMQKDGKPYLYGEGRLESFKRYIPPPCGMPVPGVPHPDHCSNQKMIDTLNMNFSDGETKQVQLLQPIHSRIDLPALEVGKTYGFCYKLNETPQSAEKILLIERPETFGLIKE